MQVFWKETTQIEPIPLIHPQLNMNNKFDFDENKLLKEFETMEREENLPSKGKLFVLWRQTTSTANAHIFHFAAFKAPKQGHRKHALAKQPRLVIAAHTTMTTT